MLANVKYGVIAIVAAGVICGAGYFIATRATLPMIEPTPPVMEPKIPIRGVFVNVQRLGEEEYVDKIKDIGANWVEIVLWVLVTENGELIPYDESIYGPPFSIEEIRSRAPTIEETMATQIKQAHDIGFKVFLCTYHERLGAHHMYGEGLRIDVENFLEEAERIAVRWAEIAENSGVEMYAPRKELQKFVGQKKALEWDDEVLPALRSACEGCSRRLCQMGQVRKICLAR